MITSTGITIMGSGRLGPTITALLGLAAAVLGARALARARRPAIGSLRTGTITAPSCSVCPPCSSAGSSSLPPTAVRALATGWSVRLPPSSLGQSASGSTGSPPCIEATAPAQSAPSSWIEIVSGEMITPGIDHIALAVPDLDAQVDRLASAFGMTIDAQMDGFALITDPSSGLKLELSRSDDSDVHFRHFGFRADDVDGAHEHLVDGGMETSEAPHRRDFAGMYTSFLKQRGGVEIQLVNYDE